MRDDYWYQRAVSSESEGGDEKWFDSFCCSCKVRGVLLLDNHISHIISLVCFAWREGGWLYSRSDEAYALRAVPLHATIDGSSVQLVVLLTAHHFSPRAAFPSLNVCHDVLTFLMTYFSSFFNVIHWAPFWFFPDFSKYLLPGLTKWTATSTEISVKPRPNFTCINDFI